MKGKSKIVVVGGGAGGIELVTYLGHQMGKKNKASIILIDQTLTHLWKPLLHEVAAGTLNSADEEINYFLHASKNHYQFEYGKMISLNREEKYLTLDAIENPNLDKILAPRKIDYDLLVIAVGSLSNSFEVPGVDTYCYFLDKKSEAEYFQQYLLYQLMKKNYDNKEKQKGLTIGIVGGGATGVEFAAELSYAIHNTKYYGFQEQLGKYLKIIIIESGPSIVPHLPKAMIKKIAEELKKRNVDILVNQRVSKVDEEGLYTKSGDYIKANLKIWAAGIKAPAFLQNLDGLETNHLRQLKVKSTLQTTFDDAIFAFGDCASCPLDHSDRVVPPRAQAAHQQARFLYNNIKNYLLHKTLKDFHYRSRGDLLSLSQQTGIGYVENGLFKKITFKGKLARLLYWLLYKQHQVIILGLWQTILKTMSHFLGRPLNPRVKLH